MENSEQTRILITGGSGFIGTNAVDAALARGWTVANIDYAPPKKPDHNIYWYDVDIRDTAALDAAVDAFQPTHVVHLAAKTGMDIKDISELDANTDGVRNLIAALKAVGTVRRVVFTSSLLVCRNGYIPEHVTDYCPPNLYGESKMRGEQIVREASLPFEWVIVRPTSIWGPWFADSYKAFFEVISRGRYFHSGTADVYKPKAYVGNAVAMIFTLLTAPAPGVAGETFYLSDWPEATTREWADEINRQLDRPPLKTVPLPVLRAAAFLGDIAKAVGKELPITSFRLNNMLTGGSYPVANTQRVVGDLPYSLSDGVTETIAWMRNQGLIFR